MKSKAPIKKHSKKVSFALSLVAAAVLSGMSVPSFAEPPRHPDSDQLNAHYTIDGTNDFSIVESPDYTTTGSQQVTSQTTTPSQGEVMVRVINGSHIAESDINLNYTIARPDSEAADNYSLAGSAIHVADGAGLTLQGNNTISLTVESGRAYSDGGAFNSTIEATSLTLSSGTTIVNATATDAGSPSIAGINVTGNLHVTDNAVLNVNVTTHAVGDGNALLVTNPGEYGYPFEMQSEGIVVQNGSTLTTDAGTTLNITVSSFGETAAAAFATGLNVVDGSVLNGTTNVTAEANGSYAIGLDVDGSVTFGGKTKVKATSTALDAVAINLNLGNSDTSTITFADVEAEAVVAVGEANAADVSDNVTVKFTGNTKLTVRQTNAQGGGDQAALHIDGRGAAHFTGSTVEILTESASNTYPVEESWPHLASGVQLFGPGTLTSSDNTNLMIRSVGTGTGTVQEIGQNETADPDNFAGFVFGLDAEGGTIDLKGDTSISATGKGAYTVGMNLQTVAGDDDWIAENIPATNFSLNAIFGGDLTVTATSETGGAEAIRLGGFVPGDSEYGLEVYPEGVSATLTTSESGVTTITASTGSDVLESVGVNFVYPDQEGDIVWTPETFTTGQGHLNLNGTTVITADHALKGDVGFITNKGNLTLNGRVDQFKGNFTQTAGSTTLNDASGGFFGGTVNLSSGSITASSAVWENSERRSLTVSGGELQIGAMHITEEDKFNFSGGVITITGNPNNAGDKSFVVNEGVTVTASGDSKLVLRNDYYDPEYGDEGAVIGQIDGTLTGLGSFEIDSGFEDDVQVRGVLGVTGDASVSASTLDVVEGGRVNVNGTLTFKNGALLSIGSDVSDHIQAGKIVFEENTAIYEPYTEEGNRLVIKGWNTAFNGTVNFWTGTNEDGSAMTEDDITLVEELVAGENAALAFNGGTYDKLKLEAQSGTISIAGDKSVFNLTAVEVNNNGKFSIAGGTTTAAAFNAISGEASFVGGSFHADQFNAQGTFTVNASDEGFTVGAFVGAAGGDFTLASGTMATDSLDLAAGKLTIATGATLSTYSGQIFTNGLNEEGTNADAGSLIYGNDHLVFAENGKLTLRDQFYNDDYAASAGSLLDGVNIFFAGKPVDSDGEVITERPIDDILEGQTESTVTITAGADESGVVTVDKTIGGKDLKLDETVTNVSVMGGKTLTLVGSAEGGDLVSFANEGKTSLSVDGGLALGGSENATKGTITSTVELGDSATLTASNGEFELSSVNANGASIEVASGSLTVDNLTLSGTSTIASAANAVTTVTNVNAEEGTHQLKGEIAAETVTGSGTLLVGSANEESPASATLNVDTLAHSGTIFIDPAWTDGAEMKDGSFLTVQQLSEEGDLKAHVVAGQNSTFVFGADKAQAIDAFDKTGLTYGKDAVSAVLYVAKAINVKEGSITVDGSMAELGNFTGVAGSVTVAANGLAMIDAKALTDGAAITAKSVTFDDGSHIRVVNLTKNSEGTLIDADNLSIANSVLEDAASSSAIVSLHLAEDGNGNLTYTTTLNKASEVFAGFEGAGLMDAMHEAAMNDVDSADRATKFLSRMAAYEDHGVSSAGSATAIGNQAMALAATAGVYNVALDASKLMNRAVDGRMSIANGLVHAEGATVWADVLATTNEAESLYGNSGYDVDLYGGVIGVDVGLGNGKLIGAAFTIGTSDGGSNGSAIDVDNDADFLGLSVYGSHRLGNFNGKVDLGYMHTKSDLSASAFGMSFGDEVTAEAWTFGIGAEYLFNVGSINITPHVGIRWTRLEVDGYEGAFKTEDDSMDVFTAPVGVAFSGNIEAAGWTFAPKLDLSIVPSFGDDEATSKVRWGNVSQSVKTQVVDDAPVQATLGLDATNGSWTFGAFYDLGIGGDDRLDNAFSLKARYAF